MRLILAGCFLTASLMTIPAGAQTRANVRDAQQALKDKGLYDGPIDGINGPKTRAAIRSYQEKDNLNEDGRLGPKTMDTLGVKHASAGTEFRESGEQVKRSYTKGGEAIGHGGKEMGSAIKHGDVVDAGKDLGKGVGHGAADVAVGTGHAVKSAAKGVKNGVTEH